MVVTLKLSSFESYDEMRCIDRGMHYVVSVVRNEMTFLY